MKDFNNRNLLKNMVSLNLTLENVEDYEWMNLEDDEEIEWRGHPSIIPHIPSFIVGFIVIGVAFAVPILYGDLFPELWHKVAFTGVLFIASTLGMVATYLRVKSTFYIFTNDKVVRKRNIFRTQHRETPYNKIQDFEYEYESILTRILNIGVVSIWTAASDGKEYRFKDVPNPDNPNKILSDYT